MELTPNNKKYLTDQELNNILTKEYLQEEYIEKQKTLEQIASNTNCASGTVKRKLLKFGFPITDHYLKKIEEKLTKEFLVGEYLGKKTSIVKLANSTGYDEGTIKKYLLKFCIPLRNRSEAIAGRKRRPQSEETKRKISQSLKGKTKSRQHKENISKGRINKFRGVNSSNWKGGITPLHFLIRSSLSHKNWIKSVFRRDDYTCQDCGIRSGDGKTVILEAHHIKEFSLIFKDFLLQYPQLNPIKDKYKLLELSFNYSPFWDITNGKTLCWDCHGKTYKKRK